MSDSNKILPRSAVNKDDTWAIEDIFPSDAAWEAAVGQLKQLCKDISAYEDTLGTSAASLYGYCTLETQINNLLRDIHGYASRRYDVDTTDSTYQAMLSQATAAYVECTGKLAFSSPEILAIPDETLARFYAEEHGLEIYRRSISDLRRMKDHILTPAEE